MENQNLPSQTYNNLAEKLKSVVGAFVGGINTNFAKAIKEIAGSPDISEDERLAAASLVGKEARRIKIKKAISEKAAQIPQDDEVISDEKPNEDWLNRFFNTVEDISDEGMQNVWAQILAGEVKRPKSFSYMALDVMRNMTKEDAEIFVKAAKFVVFRNFVLTDKDCGLTLDEKIRLTDLRLLSPEDLQRQIQISSKEDVYDITLTHAFKMASSTGAPQQLQFEGRRLTQAGKELLTLVDKKENPELLEYMINKFKAISPKISVHRICDWNADGTYQYYLESEKEYQ